ncbi:MAG TPA: pyruvate kinase [bacterium]
MHLKTRIICTIGPTSRSEKILVEMIQSGMSIARLNFAHGTLAQHAEDIRRIRKAAEQAGKSCPILIDLPGPKIRIGKLKHEPVSLRKGQTIWLTSRKIIGLFHEYLPVDYPELTRSLRIGGLVYLNDGFIQLRVDQIRNSAVKCEVLVGGDLFSHKGLNLPDSQLFVEPVTSEDLKYLEFGLSHGVDLFGISFIEQAANILKVKAFPKKKGKKIHTVAKIERAEAVKNIDSILKVTDMVMVARGDLGVEIPLEQVPIVQKKIIRKARRRGVPVITATQMLESMVHNIRPTRAEVSDVANAILDGTDFVMLSEETAIGEYPLETVQMMAKIARAVETSLRPSLSLKP